MENTWKYDRRIIRFNVVQELLDELNAFGADGWEIINYEEKKPPKFGEEKVSIILLKKKLCKTEKQ